MGLDVVVWEKATPTGKVHPVKENGVPEAWAAPAEDADHRVVTAFCYAGMERSLAGLVAGGEYTVSGEEFHFRAGSYGGYNEWRTLLARTILGVDPDAVWGDPDGYAERPFYELVNFADNEGTIGPEACERLAAAFDEHRERFAAAAETWAVEKYDLWSRATHLAAGGGLIELA